MKALGWTGGTVHDLARELGVDSYELLYGEPEYDATAPMNPEYSAGYYAAKMHGDEFFKRVMTRQHLGQLNYWFGVAGGLNNLENPSDVDA